MIKNINKHFLITNQLYKDIFKLSGNSGNLSSFAGEKQKPTGKIQRFFNPAYKRLLFSLFLIYFVIIFISVSLLKFYKK